jgi:phage host-nuclease inhibitor protein Gam
MPKKQPQPTEPEIELIEYEHNESCAQAIQRLGELQRERTSLKTTTDEQIGLLQSELAQKLDPIDEEIKIITHSLHAWCEHRKEHIFVKSKTFELPTGTMSYRQAPPSVSGNVTKKKIEDILERNSLSESVRKFESKLAKFFLRMKIEVNKDSILADPKKGKQITGLSVVDGSESFYIKPNETNTEVSL